MKYWLMKCEPSVYSIDDLERDGATQWEGVRNYQARNIMRDDMRVGDPVLFYHSNADPSGVAGVGRICREGYPDHFAWNRKSRYFDERSTPEKPVWMMVDVEFVEKFPRIVALAELKQDAALKDMMVVQKGSRLSVQPVTGAQFKHVLRMV
ncbi:MAG: EVE domain-containing protein [Verrucomicrobia bacterium]|nr:EVE domain-containing protein [Verrucomicrobiota bacterium]